MDYLRTPDDRFEGLPDWPYEPHYGEVDAGDGSGTRLRVAYVDEGPAGAAPVLLMHGEPSWSFLYRHVIPELVEAGLELLDPCGRGLVLLGRPELRELAHQGPTVTLELAELLFELTRAVNRASSIAELYGPALDALERGLSLERASVLLFDPDGVMRFKAWRGLNMQLICPGCGQVRMEKNPYWGLEDDLDRY